MNTTTDETREAAKALLRSVPEVALDRDWVKETLLEGEGEYAYYVDYKSHEVYRCPEITREDGVTVRREQRETVGCSTVTGCCAIGFVELTAICANGYTQLQTTAAVQLLEDALIELGWAEPVFRAAYDKMEGDDEGRGTYLSFDEWRDEILDERGYDEIGDGLVPEWNDRHCTGKEQVLELVAKAAA